MVQPLTSKLAPNPSTCFLTHSPKLFLETAMQILSRMAWNVSVNASFLMSSGLGNCELDNSVQYLVSSQAGRQLSQKWVLRSKSFASRTVEPGIECDTCPAGEVQLELIGSASGMRGFSIVSIITSTNV